MKVGEIVRDKRAMSPRTKAKLSESLDLIISDIFTDPDPDQFGEGHTEEQKMESRRIIIFNALWWTANDVLEQAIADGYKPTVEGVL